MRLGATLLGVATDRYDLDFSAVVLWDPCESGKVFLREINALEALRRDDFHIVPGAPVETSEVVFSSRTAEEIRSVALTTTTRPFGERTLIVARDDRGMSKRLRTALTRENVEWLTTSEQAALLDVDPMWTVLPTSLDEIATWLVSPNPPLTPYSIRAPFKVRRRGERT